MGVLCFVFLVVLRNIQHGIFRKKIQKQKSKKHHHQPLKGGEREGDEQKDNHEDYTRIRDCVGRKELLENCFSSPFSAGRTVKKVSHSEGPKGLVVVVFHSSSIEI